MIINIFDRMTQFNDELKEFEEQKEEEKIQKIYETLKFINGKMLGEMMKIRKIEKIKDFKFKESTIGLFEIRIGNHSMNIRVFACGILEENNQKKELLNLILLKVIHKKTQKLRQNDIETSTKRCKRKLEEVFYGQ